jgi:hypothetical protein
MVMRPPRVSVGGTVIDPCDIPVPLTITYGSSDIRNQPDAPSCSFQIEGEPFAEGRDLALGQVVEIDAQYTDHLGTVVYLPRFRGRVSDLTVERTGDYVATAVTAVGYQADLANQRIGLYDLGQTKYPAQTAEQRYQRIRNDLTQEFRPHVPAVPSGIWPAVDVPPADAEGARPLEMMTDVAVTVRGRIFETQAGLIKMRIAPLTGRYLTIRCQDIVDDRQWGVTGGDIVNSVTVRGYGPDPYDAVEKSAARASDFTGAGTRHQDISTLIVDDTAQHTKLGDYANAVLRDWAAARWMMPQITVDCTAMMERSLSAWSTLMAVEPWEMVTVERTAPAPVPPVPPDSQMIVLGWTETWTATDDGRVQQDMQIALGHDTATTGTTATLVNLGPVGTPTRGEEWQIRVRLLSTVSGHPATGYVHAEIVGPGTQGPTVSVDPSGFANVTVPAVDAENVSINVVSSVPGAEFSARYPLYNPQALWTDPDATWHDQDWSWTGIGV